MITQTVRADDGGKEGKWVGLSIALILLLAVMLLPHHQSISKAQALDAHQVSVNDLAGPELAMVAELRLAHEEIRNIHQDNLDFGVHSELLWPDMVELEEIWLAPFVHDKSWEHKGRHNWQVIAPAFYLGIRQMEQGTAHVVLYSGEHEPDIWFALSPKAKAMSASAELSTEALIDAGWTQVVFALSVQNQTDNHLH
ncbi:hypothetical protein C9I98_09680 [Photobacterium sanctipauli]|uniref:Uncharacterized protein n=1 Tax=Photobacterium sanctipauli TaxID=1342794 RepID=A0A2T3NVQ6_9GAMM|nr:hypothetical protein [Photobacterium sanctipauli]PSW20309.1 hypothetical protein C9I98_09680 [Photobacterium sanctipauli]